MGRAINLTREKTIAKATKMLDPAPSAAGRLAGKIAVVTGAAGNLGGYIVRLRS